MSVFRSSKMYLSLATTDQPATDLGFLLHKHPARLHEMELAFGKAHLVYPQADEDATLAQLRRMLPDWPVSITTN